MLLLKIWICVLLFMTDDFQMFLRLAYADLALVVLLSTLDVELPSDVILLPRYVKSENTGILPSLTRA